MRWKPAVQKKNGSALYGHVQGGYGVCVWVSHQVLLGYIVAQITWLYPLFFRNVTAVLGVCKMQHFEVKPYLGGNICLLCYITPLHTADGCQLHAIWCNYKIKLDFHLIYVTSVYWSKGACVGDGCRGRNCEPKVCGKPCVFGCVYGQIMLHGCQDSSWLGLEK